MKSDEAIFAEKAQQQSELQATIDRLEREHAELTAQMEEAQDKIHQLSEQVLAKQLEIDASNTRSIQVTATISAAIMLITLMLVTVSIRVGFM